MARPVRPTIKPGEATETEDIVLRTVNHLVEDMNRLADGGISPTRDLNAFTVVLDQPVFPARVKNDLRAGAPVGVVVAAARDATSQGAPPVALGGVAWTAQGDQIIIHDVAGRTNQHAYRITLLVLGV